MAGVEVIVHKGKKIHFVDNKGLQGEEVIKNQELGLAKMLESKDEKVLFLNDMTDVFATPEVDKALARIGKELIRVAKRSAVVGMSKGAKLVLIKGFIRIFGG